MPKPERQDLLCLIVLFPLLTLSLTACGKHKARARVPIPPPAASAKDTGPAKQQVPSTPAKLPAPGVSAQPTIDEAAVVAAEEMALKGISSGPQIRIGLTTSAKEIRISSTGDFYLREKAPESSSHLVQGEIFVRVEQENEGTSLIHRVQLASFAKPEAAEDLRKKLAATYTIPVTVRENTAAGMYQVRMGEFTTREEAQAYRRKMVEAGYRDAFVVDEAVSAGEGKMTLALRGKDDLFYLSRSGFLFLPSSGTTFLSVDGKSYRGLFDISLNKNERITVVNQVGTEEYLLGVVPAEMSPSSYPEFAALAAQSIAARTYALYNLGKYRSDGFDLTNDTRTQVYGGVAVERAATNEAVRQTAGLAIYYQNKLIDAEYMSTCGGRTEDFSNVFDAPPVPYLKSVFCTIESGPEKGETVIEGRHSLSQVILADDGSVANRNLEFARILGVIESRSETSSEFYTDAAEKGEAVRWIENARRVVFNKSQSDESLSTSALETRAGFLRYATEAFFGASEIRKKISARDVEYYMNNLSDGNSVPETARYAIAYIMQNSLWRPYSDNTVRPNAPMRRMDALSLLLRWIESARPEILRKGAFAGADSSGGEEAADPTIRIKWGNKSQDFRLAPKLPLFRLDAGRTTPVSSLRIIGNEKVFFHISPAGTIDLMEVELNPTGASSDRYSPSATWDIVLTRSAVAEKLRPLTGNIGEFKDLRPARIGNSGRAVQIQAIGSRTSPVLNGYKVRNALGLKDTLFTLITREHNPDGSISSFTFHGRGYGHGIGLCQVGAFGMAKAGHSYDEILKTYYQGVEIRRAY